MQPSTLTVALQARLKTVRDLYEFLEENPLKLTERLADRTRSPHLVAALSATRFVAKEKVIATRLALLYLFRERGRAIGQPPARQWCIGNGVCDE